MAWSKGNVLLGTQDMSCVEHKECPAWNTRDVLLGTEEMSCLEHRRCPAWNTRDVLLGTQEMSCLQHKKCPAWNTRDVLLGTHEMSCLEHRKCPASRALAAKPTPNAERGTRNSARVPTKLGILSASHFPFLGDCLWTFPLTLGSW